MNKQLLNRIQAWCKDTEKDTGYDIDTNTYEGEAYSIFQELLATEKENEGFFSIGAICREDLQSIGFDISNISDDTMDRIADKIHDAYVDNGLFIDLPIIADYFNVPKK